MKDKLNNKNIIIIVIVLLLILGIGFSYAWWRYTVIQDKTNVGVSKCFSIELANQANEINLTNMYPITDEEGRKLTPYTFTLKNTCSVSAKYSLNMEMLEGTTLNSNYLAVLVNNKDIKLLSSYNTATTVVKGSTESRTLDTGVLQANSSKDYSISIWMDKSVTLSDDAQNKVFKSKVVIDAVATETTLDKIVAQLDTTGKCPAINEDGTINADAPERSDGYLCSAEDNYGTSYYYRGDVTNNYVKFGKWLTDLVYGYYYASSTSSYRGYDSIEACQNASSYNKNCKVIIEKGSPMYWRIIRVNGDSTIRLIYDGIEAHENGKESTDKEIGMSAFNDLWNDNMYVGYMYGDKDVLSEDDSEYSTSSWYNTSSYYVAKEYTFDESTNRFALKNPVKVLTTDLTTDYIGYYTFNEGIFYSSYGMVYQITSITAGDNYTKVGYKRIYYGTSSKEVAQTNTNSSTIKTYLDNWYKNNMLGTENEQYLADNMFCNDRSFSSDNSGTGAGVSNTYYRWGSKQWQNSYLKCPQQNDAFTVSDTAYGNGALTYPIGLITADEVALAGGSSFNLNYYLYLGLNYWTLTPDLFQASNAKESEVDTSGFVRGSDDVFQSKIIRPVINIKPEALKLGDGSMNDPYRLSGN